MFYLLFLFYLFLLLLINFIIIIFIDYLFIITSTCCCTATNFANAAYELTEITTSTSTIAVAIRVLGEGNTLHKESMGRKTPTRKRRVEVKSPVVVNLVESDDDEETDDEEVEFLFEGKLQELDPKLPRKRDSRPSESLLAWLRITNASSSSSKCKTNKKEAAVGFNKRPFLRRRLRNVHNTLNNPKPFQQERKKRKLGFVSSPRSFSDLKSEQEKLFGAAKKKMDEDIRTGILPEKNSQMPRVSNIHSNSTSGKAFVSAVEQHYRGTWTETNLDFEGSEKRVSKTGTCGTPG